MVSYPILTWPIASYSILYPIPFLMAKSAFSTAGLPPPPRQDYTIVRPGFMGDVEAQLPEDQSLALVDDGGELKVTAIPHRSVAVSWWNGMKTGKPGGDR